MQSSDPQFHHPYTPYEIQLEFMKNVYDCIEDGKVAILESPTGTGKSLSLICGSLTWLRDHKRRALDDAIEPDPPEDDDVPQWLLDHSRQQRRTTILSQRKELEERLARIRAEEERRWNKLKDGPPRSKKMKLDGGDEEDGDEARFALDDYESDDDRVQKKIYADNGLPEGLSASTQALLSKLGVGTTTKKEEDLEPDELKIFYCSRTHSQLSQFVAELRRVQFPASIPEALSSDLGHTNKEEDPTEVVKEISLGSRKTICINPKVQKLNSATAINERCLELQSSTPTSTSQKCPYLPTRENEDLTHAFRDHAIAKIRDIEDLGQLGKQIGICPYYASREAIRPAEIVTLPYPLLLQKSAREALNLSLKDHVIIIDEAHNLMDTISSIHSITVTLYQIKQAREQLVIYLQKFRNRLKGKNRVYVTQMIRLLDSLGEYLQGKEKAGLGKKGVMDGEAKSSDLLAGKGVDQINLYKLSKYLQESKLARKVDGYITHVQEASAKISKVPSHQNERNKDTTEKETRNTIPTLTHIQSLLLPLTNPSREGRFFFTSTPTSTSLKYMLLDPTAHFRTIVEEARTVILAGGTMSPMSDYKQHLFGYLPPERLRTYSFGHVIPKSNLVAMPIERGIRGAEMIFTFEKRNDTALIDELGETLCDICRTIPDGVVVFFPSYNLLSLYADRWHQPRPHNKNNKSPTPTSIWATLTSQKSVFQESQTPTPTVDTILTAYSESIAQGKGGLLLSVVGGKMSEGINFSDSLGRGVVIVGLPFPNIHSAEWKARLRYIENKVFDDLSSSSTTSKDNNTTTSTQKRTQSQAAARDFYENACMRAVNQCVGRAIRHKNDYAAIILLDKRYGGERIRGKLPGWIRESLVGGKGGGDWGSGGSGGMRWDGEGREGVGRFFRDRVE
ncbi:MAG: ATP-dependent DNA helicase chl1 [Cirrosporium novae-zelandiae]|nr:MAG: ATP-dependent DNA helicase chl1 [Cirrosporium novae-zelandiae]